MSDLVDVEFLTNWLAAHNIGESKRGHGQITSTELAEVLLEAFRLMPRRQPDLTGPDQGDG